VETGDFRGVSEGDGSLCLLNTGNPRDNECDNMDHLRRQQCSLIFGFALSIYEEEGYHDKIAFPRILHQ
jgi:hypothetical protein